MDQPHQPKTASSLITKQAVSSKSPAENETQNFHIVLVDDEVHLVETFAKLLNYQGHTATYFSDAAAALQFLKNEHNQCDALVTDYAMPNMDGLTLVEQVRAFNKKVIIAIMTGFAEITHEEKFVRSGADLVIIKPIKVSSLLTLLAQKIVGT